MSRKRKRMNVTLSTSTVDKLKELQEALGGYSTSKILDQIVLDVDAVDLVQKMVNGFRVQRYNMNKRIRDGKASNPQVPVDPVEVPIVNDVDSLVTGFMKKTDDIMAKLNKKVQ